MKFFFDESRNTGEIGYNKVSKTLNFGNQRYFVLVGFIANENVISAYKQFKSKWIKHINSNNLLSNIIKGNDLVIRKNNAALNDFINKVCNQNDFYVTVYDKKFFIITQMINWLTTGASDFASNYFLIFTEFLMKVADEFISEYLLVTKNNDKIRIKSFL